MERLLELYGDGHVYEMEGDQATKVTETKGEIEALAEALQFTLATTFKIASPDKQPPDVAEPRGSRNINSEGFKLLTTFEGCETTAYDDKTGVWTIGYGHTQGVRKGMTITQKEADDLLRDDLEKFETFVEKGVSVSINENQFSALVCLCFNIGPKGFGDSTLRRLLNQGDFQGAADQFPEWNKVNRKPWLGLTRRRLAEQALFLDNPWQPFLNYQEKTTRSLKLVTPLMKGEDVRELQEALSKAGIEISVDGDFGAATDRAVKAFQSQKNLKVDGVVGDGTKKALGL